MATKKKDKDRKKKLAELKDEGYSSKKKNKDEEKEDDLFETADSPVMISGVN